jgi:hypothetical protein
MRMRVDQTRDDPVAVAADLQRSRIGRRRISGCAHASDFSVAAQDRRIGKGPGARSGSVSKGQSASNSQHSGVTTEQIVRALVHLPPLVALAQTQRRVGL